MIDLILFSTTLILGFLSGIAFESEHHIIDKIRKKL